MTRLGPRSRVPLSTCAYAVAAVSVAFFAAMALVPDKSAEAASAQASVQKIGPGYARMQPVDLGKPEKIAYSTPYYPRVAIPSASRSMEPAPSTVAAPLIQAPSQPVAAAARTAFSRPDIHRAY